MKREVSEAIDRLDWRLRRMGRRIRDLEERFDEVFVTKTEMRE